MHADEDDQLDEAYRYLSGAVLKNFTMLGAVATRRGSHQRGKQSNLVPLRIAARPAQEAMGSGATSTYPQTRTNVADASENGTYG